MGQEGEGARKHSLRAPSPLHTPRMRVARKGGRALTWKREEGGGKRVRFCPSFPRVSVYVIYVLFVFIFKIYICILLCLIIIQQKQKRSGV
jgi:hypothetical protein